MKRKLITAFLIAALTLAVAGCAKPAEAEGPKDTPYRIGREGMIFGSISYMLTLEELIRSADLVTDITITEWLGENDVYHRTFFSAKVNNTLKGEVYETIEIIQPGSGLITVSEFPLFKTGDRLLVFLFIEEWKESSSLSEEEWREIYDGRFMIHSQMDVLDIWEYGGDKYILSRFDDLTLVQSILESDMIHIASEETRDTINIQYAESDDIFQQYRGIDRIHHGYAFNYNDLTDKIVRISNDQGENEDYDDDEDDNNDDDDDDDDDRRREQDEQ